MLRPLTVLLVLLGACSAASSGVEHDRSARSHALRGSSPLVFSIHDGEISNYFYREPRVGAHVVLRSGKRPRWIVAFPEGNSGVAIWFSSGSADTVFRLEGDLKRIDAANGLRGVSGELSIKGPTPPAKVMLGSIRVLRNFEHGKSNPRVQDPDLQRRDKSWTWSRQTLDGHRLVIKVEFIQGDFGSDSARLRLTALHDYPAMHPLEASQIFRPDSRHQISQRSQQVFAFLSYREKLLAGSWRFLTYFGRDTLLSLALMHEVLTPVVLETGLGSVLERISEQGQVAHEEEIGEYPALSGDFLTPGKHVLPKYDYTMLDDDLLLPIVAKKILLDEHSVDRKRVARFLQRETVHGQSYATQLERNIRHVLNTARPYAQAPNTAGLIHIQSPKGLGQWRDSKEGLGYASIPYDVNAVLMPAALRAIPKLVQVLGLSEALQADAQSMLKAWSRAHQHFKVELSAAAARRLALQHAKERGVPLPATDDFGKAAFHAVGLESSGAPLAVMHSDVAFDLFFGAPAGADLETDLNALARPFPWGLYTPVGILVANPAFANDPSLRALFTPHHYHGEVFWPWQHALIVAGLERQLQRKDLESSQRTKVHDLCMLLQSEIMSKNSTTELSTWDYDSKTGYRHQAFQRENDVTESNAAQLWSVAVSARHESNGTCIAE
jgi:hypothetical protein